jgi:hypothetical protein
MKGKKKKEQMYIDVYPLYPSLQYSFEHLTSLLKSSSFKTASPLTLQSNLFPFVLFIHVPRRSYCSFVFHIFHTHLRPTSSSLLLALSLSFSFDVIRRSFGVAKRGEIYDAS